MSRIVGGTAGGRTLRTPRGAGTRPTSERVREALFSRLDHLGVVDGCAVLDLYAGSGALGLEAASRGSTSVLLVESDRAAAAVARQNAGTLGIPGVEVRHSSVERVLAGEGRPHDLVLMDPPYDLDEAGLGSVLTLLVGRGWLGPDALVVVERSRRSPAPAWPEGLTGAGEKRYGDTTVWFADAAG